MRESLRVIIDSTGIFIEKPNSVKYKSKTYSNYKHHNTAKGLIGISPSDAFSLLRLTCNQVEPQTDS